jgi:hypothetical protein
MSITRIDLKYDQPTRSTALERLKNAIYTAEMEGANVLKIVHGYGSHGTGGAIRDAVRGRLRRLVNKNQIACFIPGEEFSIPNLKTADAVGKWPELKEDRDYGNSNPGITVIILR